MDEERDEVDDEPSKGSEGKIRGESGGECEVELEDDSSSESDIVGSDDKRVVGMSFKVSTMLSSTVVLSGCSRKNLVGSSSSLDFVRSRNMRYGGEPLFCVSIISRARSSCCGDVTVLVSVMDWTKNRLRTAL